MEASNARIAAAEALGTAIVVLGGPGTAILAGDRVGLLGVALAFGFSMMVAGYLVGHVSGGHVNPAVTLAMWLTKKVNGAQAVAAVLGQLVGGFGAAVVLYSVGKGQDGWKPGGFDANGWAQLSQGHYELAAAVIVEIVFTAVLVVVMLGATNKRFPASMGPMAAGLAVTFIYLVTIPVDNGAVNPVRSLVTAVFADHKGDYLQQLWAFIVFPLVGAVVGVVAWLVVDEATLESTLLDTPQTRAWREVADKVGDAVVDAVEDVTHHAD